MQLGCGVYEHEVRGRPYLYFWHYEDRAGRRVQIKEYVGPARSDRSRTEAARRCEAYWHRATEELARMRDRVMAFLGAAT